MLVCPSCGRQNPQGQQFCGGCGARLFSGGQQQPYGAQQAYSCPRCGQLVAHGVKFCGGCGMPLNWPTQQQIQSVPVYPQQPQGVSQQTYTLERKLLFIPRASTRKFIGIGVHRQFYNLVITDRRIIAGRTGIDLVKGISRAMQDKKKYADWEPEQILQADKHNFAFQFSNLQILELKKGALGGYAYMVAHDKSGNKKQIFFDRKYYSEVENVFKQVAGYILK
jgi:hypothetical protein